MPTPDPMPDDANAPDLTRDEADAILRDGMAAALTRTARLRAERDAARAERDAALTLATCPDGGGYMACVGWGFDRRLNWSIAPSVKWFPDCPSALAAVREAAGLPATAPATAGAGDPTSDAADAATGILGPSGGGRDPAGVGRAGFYAAGDGLSFTSNPHPCGSPDAVAWAEGWDRGRRGGERLSPGVARLVGPQEGSD